MLLTPYFLHVFAHGLAALWRVAAFDGFLELGSLFFAPRVTRLFSRVFRFLRVAVKEGVLQFAAFHHRDVVDPLPEGISIKFGTAHDLRGNLHKLRFSDSLDAAVRFGTAGAAPVGNLASLALILSILVYTLFSRMFDLMQPPAVKHSIAVV